MGERSVAMRKQLQICFDRITCKNEIHCKDSSIARRLLIGNAVVVGSHFSLVSRGPHLSQPSVSKKNCFYNRFSF